MRISGLELSDVATWPWWCRAAACLASAACVLAAGYWLVLGDQRRQLAALLETGRESRVDAAARAQAARGIDGLQLGLAHRQRTLAALMGALPGAIDLPALIEDLSGAAVDSGLAIDSIDVSPEHDHDFYGVMPIALVLTGSYHQFGAFVAAAARLDRLLTFHDFQIEARGTRLTLSLAARTYRASGDAGGAGTTGQPRQVAPQRVDAKYDATGRSPFEDDRASPAAGSPAERPALHGLENFALARLRMVGVLAHRGVAYALVQDPTGRVHRVGAGNRLGLHGGRVADVSFDAVEVSETRSDAAGGWVRQLHRIELAPIRNGDDALDVPDATNDEHRAQALEEKQ